MRALDISGMKGEDIWKAKLISLKHSVRGLYRGMNECSKGHEPRNNLWSMQMVICLQNLQYLNSWNNYLSELLNVYEVTGVADQWQVPICTAQPLVPQSTLSSTGLNYSLEAERY